MSSERVSDVMYARLCETFGENDIVRDYLIPDTSLFVSFYIVSRDMAVSCFNTFPHGGHPYGSDPEYDENQLEVWRRKAEEGDRECLIAMQTWTKADPKLFDEIERRGLKHVSFWMDDLSDFDLWLAMGAPDGHDHREIYTWLPYRRIDSENIQNVRKTSRSSAVKYYQCGVFYKEELAMWNENRFLRRKGMRVPIQAAMFANRYKFLKKLPDRLTNLEILRGFRIMGLVMGHTSFDSKVMDEFIKDYEIKSIYDPCAGWGERMLCCLDHGCRYLGVDINAELEPGYRMMTKCCARSRGLWDLYEQRFEVGDGAAYSNFDREYDAVFTCPPYGKLEHYSDVGAENLDPEAFSDWWKQVVVSAMKSGCQYFCVVTNQAFRDVFLNGITSNGFSLVREYELQKRSSHLTRRKDVSKKEFETLLVCERPMSPDKAFAKLQRILSCNVF